MRRESREDVDMNMVLVLRVKMFHGFKVFLLMEIDSFGSCVWLGRVFLTGTGLLRSHQVLKSRLAMATLGRDRLTAWLSGTEV